jgi:hypothetical protein
MDEYRRLSSMARRSSQSWAFGGSSLRLNAIDDDASSSDLMPLMPPPTSRLVAGDGGSSDGDDDIVDDIDNVVDNDDDDDDEDKLDEDELLYRAVFADIEPIAQLDGINDKFVLPQSAQRSSRSKRQRSAARVN